MPNDLDSKSEICKERINKLKVNENTPSSECSANSLNIPTDDFSTRIKAVRKVSSFNPVKSKNCEDSVSVSNKSKRNYDSKSSNLEEFSKTNNYQDDSNSPKKDLSHKDKKKSLLNSSKRSDINIEGEINSARSKKNMNRRISKSFNEIPISVSKLIDFIKQQNKNDDEMSKRSSKLSKYQKLSNSNAEVSES